MPEGCGVGSKLPSCDAAMFSASLTSDMSLCSSLSSVSIRSSRAERRSCRCVQGVRRPLPPMSHTQVGPTTRHIHGTWRLS
eukprot:1840513-Rhodomonas_salina.1